MGANGAYQACSANEATGFCVKLPRLIEPISDEDFPEGVEVEPADKFLVDTVFSLPNKNLKGAIGEATFQIINN